ncbi:hypothetical protein [Archangium sp.]|uniref:hypothetical protein n=1 Tax=Archangium sp. TaxID=1872627 RepID=UPI00286B2BA6|nr:hypothetical protein [Archangium sp.]
MKYFVIATKDGVLSARDFAQDLVSRWLGAEVTHVTSPTGLHVMEFLVPMARSHLNGSLNRKGSCIAFEADLPDYAEFAQWCRSIVPPHEALTFCDEGMHGNVKLEMATTLEDLLHAFR